MMSEIAESTELSDEEYELMFSEPLYPDCFE